MLYGGTVCKSATPLPPQRKFLDETLICIHIHHITMPYPCADHPRIDIEYQEFMDTLTYGYTLIMLLYLIHVRTVPGLTQNTRNLWIL